MDYRYSRPDPAKMSRDAWMASLQKLFNDLLLRVGGDVEEALRWLEAIAKQHDLFQHGIDMDAFRKHLEDGGVVRSDAGETILTKRGERLLRQDSLDAIFNSLDKGGVGEHRVPTTGQGVERLPETRPYVFGDPVDLIDASGSLQNALRRGGAANLEMREEDFQVYETEHVSACATVLLLDISHSMILYGEDRITPAKRVAIALCELIRTRYPKDTLHVVTFGDEAKEVPLDDLPYISVGPFHTNTRGALRLARDLLRRSKHGNKQIFMITDGKPSALTERNGQIYKNPIGLDRRVVDKTLDEAVACRRYGIPVTTFMLTDDPVLVGFVEEFTEANRGRAFYSRPNDLGAYLFVDFLRNRRRVVR
ncbi:MAG: Ca-activated chloride channel family protein [Chlamydiales bacterium]|jgi:Ca-activated chloride channel family protein